MHFIPALGLPASEPVSLYCLFGACWNWVQQPAGAQGSPDHQAAGQHAALNI